MSERIAGRYERVQKFAEGAVATIWRGALRTEVGFTRPVALRELRAPWDRDASMLEAWAASASALAERANPLFEDVLDVLVQDGAGVVVTEWIEGVSLRRVLEAHAEDGRPMPWQLAATIAVELLRGLGGLHEGSLCHAGVGARSVRLTQRGGVKLTRFGVAGALSERPRRELETRGLRHEAPECARGEQATPASDRFGVGALLFEMLAGQRPFGPPGDARDAAMEAGELPDLAALRPDVPPLVVAQIERALRPEPAERFDSTTAMAAAFAQTLRVEPALASGPEALAELVREVRARPPKRDVRPQGLGEQRTMHVDLAELTVLPTSEPARSEEPESDRRPRYRFGYKERRANLAARSTPAPLEAQESEAAPLPLTRRSDEPRDKPRGLAQQKTEFLDADQVDRLILPDDKRSARRGSRGE